METVVSYSVAMFSDFVPRFVKQYAKLNTEITAAVQHYIAEVREGDFPAGEHTFDMDADILEKLY